MICTKCGAELPDDATVCSICGEPIPREEESGELPVIYTEEKLLEYPPAGADAPEEPVRSAKDDAERKKAPRRKGRGWDIAAVILTAFACAAALYPLCRDFALICIDVSKAVEAGDVFPVEGMIFASASVAAAFAADLALSVKSAFGRGGKRTFFFFAFPVLLFFWLFARINDTPARFVGSSRTAQALLCGSELFYKEDFSLISLVILAFVLCAQIAARKGGEETAQK
ncbi:MAG: zinc ribbon domain-containing protein [Clostridia bacterium]|nr:zinc ribbon domain-containing protein [Clostridia bacterium]